MKTISTSGGASRVDGNPRRWRGCRLTVSDGYADILLL